MATDYSHRDRDAGRCNFRPKSGGYHSRCYDLAVVADPVQSGAGMASWRDLRCERHQKVDLRTAKNRGWGVDRIAARVPFDAQAAIHRAYLARREAEQRAASEFWAKVGTAVAAQDLAALRDIVNRR
jgi:hypothetical protein